MFLRVVRAEYNSIDMIKVCMAIMVVAIHTNPQNSCPILVFRESISRIYGLAVPFFFVTSGFLLWNKIYYSSNYEKLLRLKGWIKKTAKLYVAWTLIYMPFTIYGFVKDDLGVIKSFIVFWRNFLLIGENYLSWPLWYLLGMLVAGCIIYMMVKWHLKLYTMGIIGVLFAAIGIVLNYCIVEGLWGPVFTVYVKFFNTTRNVFFEGLPYILIGMFIATKGCINSKKVLFIFLVVSFLFYMFGYKLAIFLLVYSFFSLVIQTELKKRNDNFYRNLRLTSNVVYFIHMIWMGLMILFFPHILSPLCLFLVVVLLSLATSTMVIRNKEVKVIKFLFA